MIASSGWRKNTRTEKLKGKKKEERKHEMIIVKMIADMLGKVSSNFQKPAAVAASYRVMQRGHAYQPSQPHVPQQLFNGIFNMVGIPSNPKKAFIYLGIMQEVGPSNNSSNYNTKQ